MVHVKIFQNFQHDVTLVKTYKKQRRLSGFNSHIQLAGLGGVCERGGGQTCLVLHLFTIFNAPLSHLIFRHLLLLLLDGMGGEQHV